MRAKLEIGRRELLRKSGLVLTGVAASTALSGCFRIPDFSSGGNTTGNAGRGMAASKVLNMKHAESGEQILVTFKEGPNYNLDALRMIDHLMRDRHQEETLETDIRLVELLHDLHYATGATEPVMLLSGYRSPVTNAMLRKRNRRAAKNSLHMKAMAADIRIPDYPTRDLRQIALDYRRGGVGYYGSRYVHVDVGDVRSW